MIENWNIINHDSIFKCIFVVKLLCDYNSLDPRKTEKLQKCMADIADRPLFEVRLPGVRARGHRGGGDPTHAPEVSLGGMAR